MLIGTLVSHGEFLPGVTALLDATDATRQRAIGAAIEEGLKRPGISEVVAAVMVSSRSDVAAHIISEAAPLSRYDSGPRTVAGEPRISIELLTGLVDRATRSSYARLLLLCESLPGSVLIARPLPLEATRSLPRAFPEPAHQYSDLV